MNGNSEILQHIETFGGAPFLNSSWDERNFNVEMLFEKEIYEAVYLFLNHYISRCPHPDNKSQEIICLKNLNQTRFDGVQIYDVILMYKELKIDKKVIQSTYQKVNAFISVRVRRILNSLKLVISKEQILFQRNLSDIDVNPTIFTISSLNNYTHNTLNWLNIINSQLSAESQLTEDSEIFIKKPEVILKLLQLMKVTSKK